MPRCRFCDHEIPAGSRRCPDCGAEAAAADLAEAERAGETATGERYAGPSTGASSGDDLDSELLDLLRRGRKIAAIKAYRERTGHDLKTAKDAVEALARRHGIPNPGLSWTGVAILLVALVVIVAGMIVGFFRG